VRLQTHDDDDDDDDDDDEGYGAGLVTMKMTVLITTIHHTSCVCGTPGVTGGGPDGLQSVPGTRNLECDQGGPGGLPSVLGTEKLGV